MTKINIFSKGLLKQICSSFYKYEIQGKLIHPNKHLDRIILDIENYFSKYCIKPSIFQDAFDGVIENNAKLLTFLCNEHRNEILLFILKVLNYNKDEKNNSFQTSKIKIKTKLV